MSPSRSRRNRKATVDYTVLSGQRKRRSRAQGSRSQRQPGSQGSSSQGSTDVEMDDATRDPIIECALTQLASSTDNVQELEYFTGQLLQEPPLPRGVFIFLTDLMCRRPDLLTMFFEKHWILTKEGVMCNASGHALTYEVGHCGDEILFDPLDFSASPSSTDPQAGPSSSADDSSLNPAVLEAEKCRLDSLPHQLGLFTLTDAPIPTRQVAGGSSILGRMDRQKASQGLITSYFAARRASSNSLLPPATIVEAPRPGGPSVHHIPRSTELARQQASHPAPAPAPASVPSPAVPLMGELDFDPEEEPDSSPNSDSDSDSDGDERAPRARLSEVPEDSRPIVQTAFEIYRILIITRAPFPDQIQRASYRQEAWSRACRVHDRDGIQMTALIRRLLDQRIPQVRGDLKTAARAMIVGGFELNGLTPTAKAAKVMTLIGERMFQLHYENIDEHGVGSGRKFMHPCILELLVQVMFRGGTASEGYRYFYLFDPISSNLLAILVVSLMVALQEHASGHARVNIPFRSKEFRPIFMRVKATIESYRDQRRDRYDAIRESILASCRNAAGVIEPANGHLLQLTLSP